MRLIPSFIAASLAAATAPSPALANGFHDLSAIDREVAGFTGAAIGQQGGAQAQVDRQLRLARCTQPLSLERYAQSAVRVTCQGVQGWRIYVPLLAVQTVAARPQAPVISRRDLLRVEAGGAGFRVVRQGEALDEGHVGETIRVKVDDGSRRGRTITALVTGPGRVRVAID